MKTAFLLKRNLAYFWRTNLAVVFGIGTAVAVLTGALLVGDSVRASLRDLFLLRLGRADYVVSAAGFFRERLADEIQTHEDFTAGGFKAVCPLIALDAAIVHEASGRRGASVQVYGVDERFWRFHEREGGPPQNREALLSEGLARELGVKAGDALLLRVVKPSAIPAESLHARKDELGRTVRLSARGALAAAMMGDFSARPQQTGVRALFVPLALLQKELNQAGRVNTLLVSVNEAKDGERRSAAAATTASAETITLQKILKDRVSLEDLGVKVRALEERGELALESDGAFISDRLAERARATADHSSLRVSPVISYLANTIRSGSREIPYSIVTAMDDASLERLRRASTKSPEENATGAASSVTSGSAASVAPVADSSSRAGADSALPPSAIILNEWAARELEIKTGETVTLEYYVWQEDGRLLTKGAQFQLAGVVPISGAAADRDLVPEYPGISGTESLSDWDPPFPVDLARVGQRDEDYWHQYRTTPKAFITLAKGQELWRTRFGKLTSIRLAPAAEGVSLHAAMDAYGASLRQALEPGEMGLTVFAARAQGLEASRGATDFGEYFLYFSFFLVVSALMLAALFFKLGVEQRLREIGTLQAIGFAAARIRSLFLMEGILLASLGTLLGLAGAILYAALMMKGLRTWWVGATGTSMLSLHVSTSSLLFGSAAGLVAASLCIVWTLRRMARRSTRSLLTGTLSRNEEKRGHKEKSVAAKRERALSPGPHPSERILLLSERFFNVASVAVILNLLGLALLLAAATNRVGQAAGFFGGGTALLVALLCYESIWLRRKGRRLIQGRGWWAVSRLGFRNAAHRPGRSVLCIALIASAAFIIVSVDAFRRNEAGGTNDKKSGSGGYALLAESVLPLVHDANTPEGREALNLWTNSETAALEHVAFTPFRVRPGDDASCLNLYEPRNPRILAPADAFLRSGRFSFQSSLAETEEERNNPWLLLNREDGDGAIPVIADANSLSYVLHLKPGDIFVLDQGDGKPPARLRVVGALADSIFQSELLMSEKNFLRLFPEQEGHRFFLLDVPAPVESGAIATLLEDRLSDFGFDVVGTDERLANFHRVENTFISTFQMLGGLGLVLGTLGLGAVLLRNVLERRRELALLRAIGYNGSHFSLMVIAENAFLLVCGLMTGAACALVAITPVIFSRGGQPPTATLGLLLLAVLASGLAASLLATAVALRSPLLSALRAE
ncbi:MAG TPA: ABC transporter permease [Pyrinomonadaceae bacterium]|jgi:ABC-type lipoprotein release transport system permease subunit|nr:ABC transporter permease [Pyrinomonadaceae bacterium]